MTNIDLWGLQGISSVRGSSDLYAAYQADPESYNKMVNTTLSVAGLIFPAAQVRSIRIFGWNWQFS